MALHADRANRKVTQRCGYSVEFTLMSVDAHLGGARATDLWRLNPSPSIAAVRFNAQWSEHGRDFFIEARFEFQVTPSATRNEKPVMDCLVRDVDP